MLERLKCAVWGHDRPLVPPTPEYLPNGRRKFQKYGLGPCRRCGRA